VEKNETRGMREDEDEDEDEGGGRGGGRDVL